MALWNTIKSGARKQYSGLKKGIKDEWKERKELNKITRAAAKKERRKQAVTSAVYKERLKGKNKRKMIKSGGNSFDGFLGTPQTTKKKKKKSAFDDIGTLGGDIF